MHIDFAFHAPPPACLPFLSLSLGILPVYDTGLTEPPLTALLAGKQLDVHPQSCKLQGNGRNCGVISFRAGLSK